MTSEQEQWLIQAVQNHERILERQQSHLERQQSQIDEIRAEIVQIKADIDEIKLQNSEIREGQAMLMSYLRQQEARRELQKMEYDRDMRQMRQEIADLRQDFLNHMRLYHPPS